MGEGAIVIECGKMIASGKSFEEIVELLPSIQSRIKVYYVVETLTYLIQGGRIGKVAGTVGELLQLKPIISINEEGTYYTYSKVRGRNKSIAKLVEIANEALVKDKSKIWVLHGGALEDGKALYETISKLPNLSEVHFGDISPVLGVHTGPGLLGIVVMRDN
ncbi:DegV domain-containing protein [bioreactor metagenome]|uniref:DegV domain-containing protein n=1 Tax=bioreactor metagenome TaxID=1076179 RepID=A0A645HKN3_9ZZZZ